MNSTRVIVALARADFLERVRRYSFFLTMLFALGLGYGAITGRITISMQGYRGVSTSAWVGSLAALITTCFVSLVGFYVVKSSVDRDRQTGVGQILAATPMSRSSYALGKTLSNFGVLASIVGVLAVSALAMQLIAGEEHHVEVVALLAPFLLVALPGMALTAAIAVLFEMLPVLRGGAGNVIWFFLWVFGGFAAPSIAKKAWLDSMGIFLVADSMQAAARKVIPDYKNDFAFDISSNHVQLLPALRWNGVDWTSQVVEIRLLWVGIALALALVAAACFDRFDPSWWLNFSTKAARAAQGATTLADGGAHPATSEGMRLVAPASAGEKHLMLAAVSGRARGNNLGQLFIAELRLALQGRHWWWYAVAAGLLIAEFLAPLPVSRGVLLGVAWLWPVTVWSAMGSRETRFATRGLLFSCSGILNRELPACYLAGVAVAMLTGAGAGVRLAFAHDGAGVVAWCAGALFLPALARALGTLSGQGKPFEAMLTAFWYIGPLNRTVGADFTGAANGAATLRYALAYLVAVAGLLAVAFTARARQLRNN
jgi:hypothetical protein